ncbi:efflux RND transporter periplasmic adaptor subunit [Streptosporangium sp. 'caverna']|uniref:efflux RND transporter periplasmic adaptor subunit n=1 Tax=Streptosporangium sp. 'caverna' TaxID=2202249 RepID=UPI000D7DA5DC|nr:peptidoglycan-binding protein [Streptosporangium sp. 'caverna']AWS46973.1 peptidoglycan-binding protein [Streptosporangium sp. 'caverna']
MKPSEQQAEPVPRKRGRAWVCSIAAVVAIGAAVAVVVTRSGGGAAEETGHKRVAGTALVERKTLQETVTSPGSLGYGGASEIDAGRAGTITRLPREGGRVKIGGVLYATDNQPVVLLRGRLPAWRAFKSDMSDGPDVRQLEQNLHAFGHFTGTPDTHFDWYTKAAILRWQDALGMKETGSIDHGLVVFAPGEVRVAETVAKVGDQVGAGTAVLRLSGLTKLVTAELATAKQALAKARGKVTVNLPAGKTTTGTISGIGSPRQQKGGDGKAIVVPVTITLDHPAATGRLQEVSVSIDFPTASRKNVLTVPVAALIALPEGGYGVEVVRDAGTTQTVAVKPGLFAAGSVEVTGDGLDAGQKVVVPTL